MTKERDPTRTQLMILKVDPDPYGSRIRSWVFWGVQTHEYHYCQGFVTWVTPAGLIQNNVMLLTFLHLPPTSLTPNTSLSLSLLFSLSGSRANTGTMHFGWRHRLSLPSSHHFSHCLPICPSILSVLLNYRSQIEFSEMPNCLLIEKEFQRVAGEGDLQFNTGLMIWSWYGKGLSLRRCLGML